MAVYQNPQAAAEVLMGGPPTPEEQEIASRIMNEGLSSVMAGGPPAQQTQPMSPAAPVQQTQPMIAEAPQPQIPGAGAMEEEIRGDWILMNESKKVPWNPNTTWGDFLKKVLDEHGRDAVDKLIDQQLKNEAENPPETETEVPGLRVMDTIPLTQEGIAAATPNATPTLEEIPPTDPSGAMGGIMGAAKGGLVGFAEGGLSREEILAGQGGLDKASKDAFGNIIGGINEIDPTPTDVPLGPEAYAPTGPQPGVSYDDPYSAKTIGNVVSGALTVAGRAGMASNPVTLGIQLANAAINPDSTYNKILQNRNPIPTPLRGIIPGLPADDSIIGNPQMGDSNYSPSMISDAIALGTEPFGGKGPSISVQAVTEDSEGGGDPGNGGDVGDGGAQAEGLDDIAKGGIVGFADGGLMGRGLPSLKDDIMRPPSPFDNSSRSLSIQRPLGGNNALQQIGTAQDSLQGAERTLQGISGQIGSIQSKIGQGQNQQLLGSGIGQVLGQGLGGFLGGVFGNKPMQFGQQIAQDLANKQIAQDLANRGTPQQAFPMNFDQWREKFNTQQQGIPLFAEGGLNTTPGVSEEEFMSVISEAAGDAGVSGEEVAAVSEIATQTAPANDNEVMDSGIMQTVEAVDAEEEDLSGIGSLTEISNKLAEAGQEPLIHASMGEIVFDPNRLPENERNMLFAALETAGIDPTTVTVGSQMPLNEVTGLPAAGIGSFFKKIFKPVKKVFKKVGKFLKKNAGTILGIAGALTGNPLLAALGSGVGSLIEGKPLQSALLSAGLSFAGTKWVGPWIGEKLGGISSALDTPIGEVPIVSSIPGVKGATAAGVTTRVAESAATQAAATNAIAEAGVKGATSEAITNAAIKGAASKLTTSVADKAAAEAIGTKVADSVISGALKSTATAYSPYAEQLMGSGVSKLLSTPTSTALGGITAGIGQKMVEPMAQAMISGVPAGMEEDVMDAWSQRYDYDPTPGQLYQFYTSEYTPPTTVPANQIIAGLPGYTNLGGAAGGGYINGVGGPKSDSNLARLSDGEFVMTAKAVEGAGNGDRMAGARRMYEVMNGLERRVA